MSGGVPAPGEAAGAGNVDSGQVNMKQLLEQCVSMALVALPVGFKCQRLFIQGAVRKRNAMMQACTACADLSRHAAPAVMQSRGIHVVTAMDGSADSRQPTATWTCQGQRFKALLSCVAAPLATSAAPSLARHLPCRRQLCTHHSRQPRSQYQA